MASKVAKPKTRKVTKNMHYRKVEGLTPATIMRLQDVATQLSEGKSRATIIKYLQDKYEIAYDTAKDYYQDGVKYLLPEDENEYRQELIQVNIERLELIYQRAVEEGDWKNAKEAVAELNKIAGVNGNNVQIGYRSDKDNNTEFIIKLNND